LLNHKRQDNFTYLLRPFLGYINDLELRVRYHSISRIMFVILAVMNNQYSNRFPARLLVSTSAVKTTNLLFQITPPIARY
jgi:hypothetical protein